MLKRIRWSLLFYTILGLGAAVGLVVLMGLIERKDATQVCTSLKVNVEGKETFIDQEDISKMINNQFGNVVGKSLREIKLEDIEQAIEKLPYVSQAEIHMDMDGTVRVNVKQREVVLRVINSQGREFYVDTEGHKVPVTLKYVPRVLVANGNIKESYNKPLEEVETILVKNLVRIVEHVRGNELWENQIVQMYVNQDKDIELIPRVGKEVLLIGNADSLDSKLRRLELYYKNILPKVGTEAYSRINVKYGGQIICERREGWFMDSLQMKISMKN